MEIQKKQDKNCSHEKRRMMIWPDGGESELCESCLRTRHVDIDVTEWQDHQYENVGDWYREASEFQDSFDNVLKIKRFNSHVIYLNSLVSKLTGDERIGALLAVNTVVDNFITVSS